MPPFICAHCRVALRNTLRYRSPLVRRVAYSTTSSNTDTNIQELLSKPTWSIRSLFPDNDDAASRPSHSSSPDTTITPTQLHHLLRLSALPLPRSTAEQDAMLATLQSQLRFVRAVQRADTTGVEPLRAIRDETDAAAREGAVTLDDLRDVLDSEISVGHYRRLRRVRETVDSDAEKWDALSTASRTAGKYFVVESAGKEGGG